MATALAFGIAGSAHAQIAALADGNASYTLLNLPEAADADAPRITFTADPTNSPNVGHSFWWYFRLGGDTRETTLHGGPAGIDITSIETTPDRTILRWDDVNGRGLSAVYMVTLFETGVGTGHTLHQLTMTNRSGAPVDLELFAYADVDQCGTPRADSATGVLGRHTITDIGCPGSADTEIYAIGASHDVVGSWPTVLDLLVDNTAADLPDTGLPYATGDFTAAYQFSSPTLADGEDFTAITVMSHGGTFVDCGNPAAADVFGTSALGTFGAPVLESLAPPVIAGSGEIRVSNTLPNITGLMFYGTSLLNGQAGVPAFGMDFFIDALGTFNFSTDANGSFQIPLSLPFGTMLCGEHFYMRGVIADPAATTQFGISATGVLDWTIGQ